MADEDTLEWPGRGVLHRDAYTLSRDGHTFRVWRQPHPLLTGYDWCASIQGPATTESLSVLYLESAEAAISSAEWWYAHELEAAGGAS